MNTVKMKKDTFKALSGDMYCPSCGVMLVPENEYVEPKESEEGIAESATTTDYISRADTIKAMCAECWCEYYCGGDCTEVAVVKGMPPVTPTEQQEHGRLIDADRLLQELFIVDEEEWTTPEIRAILENAPSVTPTERIGEWIEHKYAEEYDGFMQSNFECSKCHDWLREPTNYCPSCGCAMTKGGDTE